MTLLSFSISDVDDSETTAIQESSRLTSIQLALSTARGETDENFFKKT